MKIREILYSSKFVRKMKKVPGTLANIIQEREIIFQKNCFDPRLKTHKLHGELDGFYSFSISHAYRIIFSIPEKGVVEFIDIGDHSIYQ